MIFLELEIFLNNHVTFLSGNFKPCRRGVLRSSAGEAGGGDLLYLLTGGGGGAYVQQLIHPRGWA